MVTYTSSQDAWNALRGARSAPPGRASDPGPWRRETFSTALEQAEQFFRAADAVGTATQPLQLFYGLSQAGRAIAAAARDLKGDTWMLNGHGIQTKVMERDLPAVPSITTSKGSFVRLSGLLRSPLWAGQEVTFAELWDCLPVSRGIPLSGAGTERVVPILIDHHLHPVRHLHGGIRVGGLPARVLDASDRDAALAEYLARFPGARSSGATWWYRDGEERLDRRYEREADGSGSVALDLRAPDGGFLTLDQYLDRLRPVTRRHDGNWYFTPAVGGSTHGMHPLMAWWAVMHVLSDLARYQPAQWARHIDVDKSAYAVPIERLLAEARSVLPIVIAETLDEVAA
ncbi:YaaC family protein [Kitasatospora sp. NPDC058063]|uniref:YaaC family protein n=1 Tax=unclassified Kitasatospora TaxID=2633591 RepID=UPI0036DC83D0